MVLNNRFFYKTIFVTILIFVLHCLVSGSSWATLFVNSQTTVDIELSGYYGLTERILFRGGLSAGTTREIETSYQGLVLLVFSSGQSYSLILGNEPLSLKISRSNTLSSFAVDSENELFYRLLSGENCKTGQYPFAQLLIQAKELLESSHDIHTTKELLAKKNEFHEFVSKHYEGLSHSDMIIRLIAQYFMMHEYVDYYIKGEPAANIRQQYQQAILNGVGNWIRILTPYIPDNEILNYCVSLYYNRSMVSLASLIITNYRDTAYCQGLEKQTFNFPNSVLVTDADNMTMQLSDIKSIKIVSFVSEYCPVSMVKAVCKARQLANQKQRSVLIVAPLQKLSEKHLTIRKMVSGGNILFINDEKWRKEHLVKKIKLPLFVEIE